MSTPKSKARRIGKAIFITLWVLLAIPSIGFFLMLVAEARATPRPANSAAPPAARQDLPYTSSHAKLHTFRHARPWMTECSFTLGQFLPDEAARKAAADAWARELWDQYLALPHREMDETYLDLFPFDTDAEGEHNYIARLCWKEEWKDRPKTFDEAYTYYATYP